MRKIIIFSLILSKFSINAMENNLNVNPAEPATNTIEKLQVECITLLMRIGERHQLGNNIIDDNSKIIRFTENTKNMLNQNLFLPFIGQESIFFEESLLENVQRMTNFRKKQKKLQNELITKHTELKKIAKNSNHPDLELILEAEEINKKLFDKHKKQDDCMKELISRTLEMKISD